MYKMYFSSLNAENPSGIAEKKVLIGHWMQVGYKFNSDQTPALTIRQNITNLHSK